MNNISKIILKVFVWLAGLAVILAALLLGLAMLFEKVAESSCIDNYMYGVSSPNGEYFAAVRLKDCGATTSEGYHVYIFTVGSQQKPIEAAWFDAPYTSTVNGINICWTSDDSIVVSYKKTKHYWVSKSFSDASPHGVTIVTHPGSDLPAGVCK